MNTEIKAITEKWHVGIPNANCGPRVYDEEGWPIADCGRSGKRSFDEQMAYAHLIACAPEMLSALIKCYEILKAQAYRGHYPPELMQENGGCGLSFISDIVKKATLTNQGLRPL